MSQTTPLRIRMDPETKERLRAAAAAANRSLTDEIERRLLRTLTEDDVAEDRRSEAGVGMSLDESLRCSAVHWALLNDMGEPPQRVIARADVYFRYVLTGELPARAAAEE